MAALFALTRSVANSHLPDVEAARVAYLGPATDEVTREELLDRVRSVAVTVLDVRPAEEYAAGHIPGAVGIPLEELPDRLAELPAGQEVIAYCRGSGRPSRRCGGGCSTGLDWPLC